MFFRNNILGIIWGIVILILSILPGNYFPEVPSYLELFSPDKLIHLFIFGVFTVLLFVGFQKQYVGKKLRSNNIIYAALIGTIYGSFTELLQLLIDNGRHSSFYDFIADLIGCLIGMIICRLLLIKKTKI
ncbi:MAG: VanZ family protein [Bacteroidetes bacterium]|nr:VanZ family protein [Bacteroidota bacterium]